MESMLSAARNEVVDRAPPRKADPDADVIELVRIGDLTQAIERLMQRHGAAVYRYCCVELRNAALADDVQQQVFIEAYRDLRRFGKRSTVRVWLFAISRHRVLDAVKQQRRGWRHVADDAAGDLPDPSPSSDEVIDDARLSQALAASLAEIDEPVRTAVLLHYQQGFTFAEMAEICHEKAGTLCARVARALPQLRARIEARLGIAPSRS